jgi:hypothetical protein
MFAKRLLYIAGGQLSAYLYKNKDLSFEGNFSENQEGYAQFRQFLSENKLTPLYILTDLVEEDYRLETIPHVIGKDHYELLKRKLNQFYRNTPFRGAIFQGRETGGRHDDKLLITGLTNPDNLKGWIEAIKESRAPLAGIFSLALITEMLVKKLGLSAEHQLIMTQQKQSGLRQSYFQKSDLKFSRLSPVPDRNPKTIADNALQETVRTHQYLTNLKLLPREKPLDVIILSSEQPLQEMRKTLKDTAFLQYHFLDIAEVVSQLKIKLEYDAYCDSLFLYLFGHYTPKNQYAAPSYLHDYRLAQIRFGAYALGVIALFAGLSLSVLNVFHSIEYTQETSRAVIETNQIQSQYLEIAKTFPIIPTTPEKFKSVIDTSKKLDQLNLPSNKILANISRVLDGYPQQVSLTKLMWTYSSTPESVKFLGGETATATSAPAENAGEKKNYLVGLIEGEFKATNHTKIINGFKDLEKSFKAAGAEVTILKLPINIDPNSTIEGMTGGTTVQTQRPLFQMRVTWSVTP